MTNQQYRIISRQLILFCACAYNKPTITGILIFKSRPLRSHAESVMKNDKVNSNNHWGLATEKFFYYYMGLRKADVRNLVAMMQSRYPDDSPERLARRFISAQIPLSLVGSSLIHIPTVFHTLGPAFRFMGLASGTTVMMILNMTLVMQIAMLYGHDIDDRARLKELLVIITTTGLASSSTALIPQLAALAPAHKALTGAAAIITTSQLTGELAVKYFSRSQK